MVGWMDPWIDRWTDGWMDGWTWMDGWIDRQIDRSRVMDSQLGMDCKQWKWIISDNSVYYHYGLGISSKNHSYAKWSPGHWGHSRSLFTCIFNFRRIGENLNKAASRMLSDRINQRTVHHPPQP